MAEITEARLVGDWRRIVGDHVVSFENGGELDDVGVTGTVTLTPNFGRGPQGVLADDASLYTAHEIKCRVMWGRLHDNDLNNPWQDLIVAVDGKPIVWTAAFSLTYKWRSDVQAQKINLPQVTFDVNAVTAGEISLTSLIPSAQIPSNYQPYLVSAQASAQVASDAKTVAELSALAADQAKVDAEQALADATQAKTDAETAAALATQEADRAVGLATAQDQAVADTVTAGGPTTAALDATNVRKQKEIEGGQYPRPIRAPILVIDDEFPKYGDPDYRMLWRDGDDIYAYYASVAEGPQLAKSSDAGATWTRSPLPFALSPRRFLKLENGDLLAGGPSSPYVIYRSTDDGATWAPSVTLREGEVWLGPTSWCEDLLTGDVYFGVYYYDYGEGSATTWEDVRVYRSTDSGATWSVFHAFPSAHTTDPDRITHIHAVQYDPVSQRVYIMTGDGVPAAGIYRVTASGTSVEPVILNAQMPGIVSGARAIGLFCWPDYIGWPSDSTDGVVRRMLRSDIGAANPVVEDVYRCNGPCYTVWQAADDASKWMFSATSKYGLDTSVHLYVAEDQGATVYEVGAFGQDMPDGVQCRIDPVGQPHKHGAKFWISSANFETVWTLRARLAYGSAGFQKPRPAVELLPQPTLPSPLFMGETNMPPWLANQAVTIPSKSFRGLAFTAERDETINRIWVTPTVPVAPGGKTQVAVYRVSPAGTLLFEASSSLATVNPEGQGRFSTVGRTSVGLSSAWEKRRGRWYVVGIYVDAAGGTPPKFLGWATSGDFLPPGGNRITPRLAIGVSAEGSQTGIPADGSSLVEVGSGPCLYMEP